MDDLIKEFQSQNGNVTYTTKELIQGLHVKMDRMNEGLNNRVIVADCIRRKSDIIRMVIGMFSFTISCIGALAYYVLMR